ncbi:uncharacterized protein LOC131847760 [Achroia grisella]|uniref:uncharacterized protein LOC131847760 n=1 Tax=Achroia grisella TaxID=688607 RepID=UPI0027D31F9B|nr:uncharacterized protein LOC131847760 [Achroia grisella]
MNLNNSDFKSNVTLDQVMEYFNLSITNITNKSDVSQIHLFDLYEAYSTKEKEQLLTYQIVAYVLGTLIILSNLVVVVSSGLILKKGQQHKSTYLLLGNVSLADTIIGISIIFGATMDNNINSDPLCIFQLGLLVCPTMVSIFSVGFIAVDRYIYILHGLYYQRWFNTTRVRIGILCIWIIGITLGFMPLTGWVTRELNNAPCVYIAVYPSTLILFNSFISVIPIILVAILYTIILIKALKNLTNLKTAEKNVKTITKTKEKPKLRIYRGKNKLTNTVSVNYPLRSNMNKLERSVSFNTNYVNENLHNVQKSECSKAKSIDDLTVSNGNISETLKCDKTKQIESDLNQSEFSIHTVVSTSSDRNLSLSSLTLKQKNGFKITNPKAKEPNKCRAVTVVMLTSCSFIATWMPFFIIMIFCICHSLVKMGRLLGSLLFLIAAVYARHEQYEGHQLYRVGGPADEIAYLEASLDLISITPAERSISGKLEVLVRLSPEVKEQWLQYFDERSMPYTKIADNLADILRDEETKIQSAKAAAKQKGRSISWDTYYNYEEINAYIDELGAEYPELVTVINAGLSYEGRQIKYVRISSTGFENLQKPVIIIDAAVHAREWVTTPVALYIINQLVVDIVDRQLTNEIDWIIIPLANPDGYEFSIEVDRMWRKTRSLVPPNTEACPGVDGNRNFDHHWGTNSAAANPCAITFEGPSVFSEPEIRIIRDVVYQQLSRASLYISLHSFGNMFLYAWGNNGTLPSNGLNLHLAGVTMATAIDELALNEAPRYIVGNAANVLYFTTGTSRDWTRSVGIPLTYTLELPGYSYGFLVPPEYVEQIVTETWEGIAAGGHFILSDL